MKFIRRLAYKIAYSVQEAQQESHHMRFVYYYGYQGFISQLLEFLCIILIGLIFNVFIPIVIIASIFAIMRSFIGGYHMRSGEHCFYLTAIIIGIPAIITKYVSLTDVVIPIITALVYLFVYYTIIKYAPVDTVNKPIPEDKKPTYKRLGLIFTTILLVVTYILFINGYKMIILSILFGIALETLTVVPFGYNLFSILEKNVFYFRKENRQ